MHLRIAERHVIDDLVNDLLELQHLERHWRLLLARDLDEIADEGRHPFHLRDEIAKELLALDGIRWLAALEELEVGAEAGEGSSQLVRRISHELSLRTQRCLELSEHGVEARAEPAELVAAPRGDATRKIAGFRDLFDRGCEPFHRRECGATNERTEGGRQQNRAGGEGDQ